MRYGSYVSLIFWIIYAIIAIHKKQNGARGKMIILIEPKPDQIYDDILADFNHRQLITKKWVHDKEWILTETSDLREWSDKKRKWIPSYLREQTERGGTAILAYDDDNLVGFCCLDGYLLGKTAKYANLTMLFVDDNFKRKGVEKKLFEEICKKAAGMKADKLFISAIPSYETITFYISMGCEDAKEIIDEYIDPENDRYLELSLSAE